MCIRDRATTVTLVATNTTDAAHYPVFVDTATGNENPRTDTGFTYNPNSGLLTSGAFSGPLTGNVTGNASGTAATVTAASQAAITTAANLVTIGTVTSGTLSTGAVLAGVTVTMGSDAEGDIYYRNSSGVLTRLAAAQDGYVLTATGAGAAPAWEPAAGGALSGDNFATDLKIGRDSHNLIDFATTDNKIVFRVSDADEVQLGANNLSPTTTDGASLGTSSLNWSDLFLDSGAVINFDSDDIKITHSTNNLLITGDSANSKLELGIDGTGMDLKVWGDTETPDKYLSWDQSADRLRVHGNIVNEFQRANNSPEALDDDNTITLYLRESNVHNYVLTSAENVTLIEFVNSVRGQKFLLRLTQPASGTVATVSWADVDQNETGTAATVRWPGGTAPTMTPTLGKTDVYGFLCTGAGVFDAFIIGQNL